jgi:hypothetical protein
MIVGGNIDGVTRVMTTAIALETSKGDLPLALALGLVLLASSALLNVAIAWCSADRVARCWSHRDEQRRAVDAGSAVDASVRSARSRRCSVSASASGAANSSP